RRRRGARGRTPPGSRRAPPPRLPRAAARAGTRSGCAGRTPLRDCAAPPPTRTLRPNDVKELSGIRTLAVRISAGNFVVGVRLPADRGKPRVSRQQRCRPPAARASEQRPVLDALRF